MTNSVTHRYRLYFLVDVHPRPERISKLRSAAKSARNCARRVGRWLQGIGPRGVSIARATDTGRYP
jgi:hypothetical protein